jgi:hypothetical protein
MRTAILLTVVALLLSGCISFSGGEPSPLFNASFRSGSSFPNLDPFENVVLVDVSTTVDRLPAQTLRLSIDGTQVHTQTVNSSGRIEVTFPPAAWTPSAGEHELEVEMGEISRILPFTWHD